MQEYYIVKFTWKGKNRFITWYTNDEDGVVLDGGKVALFENIDECKAFASKLGIGISEESNNRYDFDSIYGWTVSPKADKIEPVHFIDAWNLADDITSSLNKGGNYTVTEDEDQDLYNKLFWANNLSAVTPVGSEYEPIWSDGEINALARSLNRVLRVIESITPSS